VFSDSFLALLSFFRKSILLCFGLLLLHRFSRISRVTKIVLVQRRKAIDNCFDRRRNRTTTKRQTPLPSSPHSPLSFHVRRRWLRRRHRPAPALPLAQRQRRDENLPRHPHHLPQVFVRDLKGDDVAPETVNAVYGGEKGLRRDGGEGLGEVFRRKERRSGRFGFGVEEVRERGGSRRGGGSRCWEQGGEEECWRAEVDPALKARERRGRGEIEFDDRKVRRAFLRRPWRRYRARRGRQARVCWLLLRSRAEDVKGRRSRCPEKAVSGEEEGAWRVRRPDGEDVGGEEDGGSAVDGSIGKGGEVDAKVLRKDGTGGNMQAGRSGGIEEVGTCRRGAKGGVSLEERTRRKRRKKRRPIERSLPTANPTGAPSSSSSTTRDETSTSSKASGGVGR
jgi:hypothetical protein